MLRCHRFNRCTLKIMALLACSVSAFVDPTTVQASMRTSLPDTSPWTMQSVMCSVVADVPGVSAPQIVRASVSVSASLSPHEKVLTPGASVLCARCSSPRCPASTLSAPSTRTPFSSSRPGVALAAGAVPTASIVPRR